MNKYITPIITILFCTFSLGSFGAEHVVKMLNSGKEGSMIFEPSVLKIEIGDSVTFKATDTGHNSVSIPNLIPAGAENWQGNLNQDVTVSFEKEGVYVYQCSPHIVLAMVGVIAVGEATNLEQIMTESEGIQQSFVMNKDRLESYLATLN